MNSYSKYNVKFRGFCRDQLGALHLGNGDMGASVWIQEDKRIYILLSKTDSFAESARLLKLGMVILDICPNLFTEDNPPETVLDIYSGTISLTNSNMSVTAYVDSSSNVLTVIAESKTDTRIHAECISWRKDWNIDITPLASENMNDEANTESPDIKILQDDCIGYYHYNTTSNFKYIMDKVDLPEAIDKFEDPVGKLLFGYIVSGKQCIVQDDKLLSRMKKNHCINIYSLTGKTNEFDSWYQAISNMRRGYEKQDILLKYAGHRAYWKEFWNRSYIFASGDNDAETATKGYIYQRYLNACAGRGAYPIKFNGSIFTLHKTDALDAIMLDRESKSASIELGFDYRRWGAPYWVQNTRLIYWSILYSGDYSLMKPFLIWYLICSRFGSIEPNSTSGITAAIFLRHLIFMALILVFAIVIKQKKIMSEKETCKTHI